MSRAFAAATLAATIGTVLCLGTQQSSAAALLAVDFNGPSWDGVVTEDGFTAVNHDADLITGHVIGSYTLKTSHNERFSVGVNDNPPFTYAALLRDHIFINSGSAYGPDGTDSGGALDVTIDGFDPNTQYTIKAYSYDSGHPIVTTKFWAAGTGTLLGTVSLAGAPVDNDSFSTTFNLTSDSNGQLAFTVTATWDGGYLTRLSGFEVSAVPEPASIALLGLAAPAVLARRRRAI
jgi:hypothetical protein